MSRVRNADESCQQFRKICADYERLFQPRISAIREQFERSPAGQIPRSVDESLEAHIRAYVVNALLAALNWRLDARPEDGLPNLVPEAPIKSEERGTTRFLDYFGLERQTEDPLLVVETKRPNSPLPRVAMDSEDRLAWRIPEIISQSLAGEPVMGEWSEWLATLQDYIRSIYARTQRTPRRVILTNGDWLLLFLEPADAFCNTEPPNPNYILVFLNRPDIEARYTELFRYVEYGSISKEMPGLTPSELSFHVPKDAVDCVMHGLRLRYIEQPGIYQPSPVIKVAPVIFVRSRYWTWIRVETPPREYELPHDGTKLLRHLTEVQKAATQLLCQVNAVLDAQFRPSPLSKHYEDEEAFDPVRGIVECEKNEFFIVTGDKTHYFTPEPSVAQCPHHDWGESNAVGVASNPGPVLNRSIEPRAFFISTEVHHCAHRDVAAAKASQITAENRGRCGLRSGEDSQAFCEIWRFETHLCCRTCVFEAVCTKAEVFHLPCRPSDRVS